MIQVTSIYDLVILQLYTHMYCKQKKQPPSLENLTERNPDQKTVSLPLQFQYLSVDILSKEFTKLNNNHAYRIHYLGPRPHNTITLHKKYSYAEKNPHQCGALAQNVEVDRYKIESKRLVQSYLIQQKLKGNSYYRSGLFYRAFEGMNPYLGEGEWVFNSLFESGNLDCAIKIKQNEFDLFLKVDSNTKGHVQWFYYSVKNGKRKNKLKMNLCNLSKGKTLYDLGLQPYVFSKLKNSLNGETWTQSGVNLGIQKKELRYEYLYDKLPSHLLNSYCLELSYNFEFQDDEVFFAYCVPFTFSRLLKEISELPPQWVKSGILGKSLSGIDIPLLHISNHDAEKQKKNILITGRWHPGQSNSSHMLQGFINFLTGTSREATELRNRINFFIVPMANPDGVICGNSRTSLAGKDLNRQFTVASKDLYPQVAQVKELARKIQTSYGLLMYLDFHGHSRKKNTFFYGPSFPIHQPNYYKSRILPKLVEKVDSNFRFYSCTFTLEDQKKHTARAVIFQHLKVALSFTIETSIGSFYDCENMKTQPFNEHAWRTIGTSIAQGLSKFMVGFQEYEEMMRERRMNRQRRRPLTPGKHSFTQQNNEEEEISSYFKQGPPLKIGYQDKSLFGNLIDELKSTKNNNFIKEIDQQYDSDSHDEAEEFQASKMKQFNNLIRDAAKRDPLKDKSSALATHKSLKSHRQSQEVMIDQIYADEQMKFLQELQAIRKTAPTQITKEHSRNTPLLPKTAGQNKRIYQNPRMTVLSQIHSKVSQQQAQLTAGRKSIDKKIVSQSELSDKMSYFGEFRIFVDKQKVEDRSKTFHRNSIFNRDRSKNSKRSVHDETRFMSQTFFQKPSRTAYIDSSNFMNLPSKPTNFQFKFDQIDTAMMAKQKLKEYLKTKIQRSSRSSTIGPASFYGVRQNINQKKLSNKQKFLSRGENSKKDSIKIIKFT